MAKHYEINEKDIDEVIRYLKTVDPENATPEMAIALLEQLQASVHLLSHENPELLDKIYQDLKNKKST
jgi:cytochrome oxidase Cu insertion factor (SCO1/SenC/PrrC family)